MIDVNAQSRDLWTWHTSLSVTAQLHHPSNFARGPPPPPRRPRPLHGDPLFWHKHLHAFTLVLYIFHYPVQDVLKSMYATSGGVGEDPVSLCFRFIALNFTVVFLLYVIFSLTPLFGIPASVMGPPGGKRATVFGA